MIDKEETKIDAVNISRKRMKAKGWIVKENIPGTKGTDMFAEHPVHKNVFQAPQVKGAHNGAEWMIGKNSDFSKVFLLVDVVKDKVYVVPGRVVEYILLNSININRLGFGPKYLKNYLERWDLFWE